VPDPAFAVGAVAGICCAKTAAPLVAAANTKTESILDFMRVLAFANRGDGFNP
jgi:hypothetical protein